MESLAGLAAELAPAAVVTLEFALIVYPLAVAIAVVVALTRLAAVPVLGTAAAVYVELVRSTPLLLQLFFVFFGLPFVGLTFDAWPTAVITFSLCFAAYQSEVLRAAVLSVPAGLTEAATVLGMSGQMTFRRVIAPLALRVAIPPMANSWIELLKATTLVSIVAIRDILFVGQTIASRTFQTVEIFFLISAFFVAIVLPTSWLIRRVEARVAFSQS